MKLKRIQLVLTWFTIPVKLIPINLKWLNAMIGYKKLALNLRRLFFAKDKQILISFCNIKIVDSKTRLCLMQVFCNTLKPTIVMHYIY